MTPALLAALIEAGVQVAPEIVALFHAIFHHKNPTAAAKVATKAVVATPDDADTNSPTLPDGSRNPWFVE